MAAPGDRRHRPLRSAALTLAAWGLSSCQLDTNGLPCYQDDDCAPFFVDNKPTFCQEGACVVREAGCDSNTQCAGLGPAYICTNSTTTRECVSTQTEECGPPIYPDGQVSGQVVFFGLMVPRQGVDAAIGAAVEKAALAALTDFNAVSALQDGAKVAAVVCDTRGDPTIAVKVAEHLGELTFPAFVGPVDDLEFTEVVDQVTFAPRVNAFTMGPMITAGLDELDAGDLVFSTMPGAKYQGRALGARLAVDIGGEAVDSFLMLANDAYGRSLYEAAATESTGEGKPQRIPELEGNQLLTSYDDVDRAMTFIADQIDGGGVPSVLILFGRSEVAEILERYRTAGYPLPQKIYVSHRAMEAIAALGDASLAPVVVAIAPEFDARLAALRQRVGDAALRAEGALAYDATMSTLLAMAAVKAGDPVVGLKLAVAVGKLSDMAGAKIDFAQPPATFLAAAKAAFAAGEGVDVSGFSGALDFDAAGEVCGPLAAYRLDASGTQFEKFAVFTPVCPDTSGTWADLP